MIHTKQIVATQAINDEDDDDARYPDGYCPHCRRRFFVWAICENCGELYGASNAQQRFCGEESCRKAAYRFLEREHDARRKFKRKRREYKITCINCFKEKLVSHKEQRFCSPRCNALYHSRARKSQQKNRQSNKKTI